MYDAKDVEIFYGSLDLTSMDGKRATVVKFVNIPEYNPTKFGNDIGLAETSQLDLMDEKVAKAIQLHTAVVGDDSQLGFTGWGWTVSIEFIFV